MFKLFLLDSLLSVADVRAQCDGGRVAVQTVPPASPAVASEFDFDTYEHAFAAFERQLLTRLLPQYPSTRRLALRLGLSHTSVANKLRRYGLKVS